MRFKSLNKGFKRSFIKSLRLAPHVFILFSIFISNIVYPTFAIAQDLDILVGEESTNEIIPIDESEDILDEGISTSVFEDGVYTIDKVVEGEEYVYPENENVRVKFNRVTEDGNLVIKRIILTEEQKTSLNTKDDYGWDISSTMNNGTFSYNLTLPNTQGNDIQVKYTEDGNTYESIDNSNVKINSNIVSIEGLDHFTLFVVVDDGDTNFSAPGWGNHPSGYQGDHKYVTSSQTDKTATWMYTGTDISNGAVFLSWTIWNDHATNATYKSSLFSDVTINQKLNAEQTTADTNGTWSGWYRVPGEFNISTGSTVTLSPISGTDGNLSADAVAFVDLNEAPNEVWVDDNYSSNNSGEHFWGYDAFNNIQNGIDAVKNGGTVYVAAGTYNESLNVNKSINLQSTNGKDSTTIQLQNGPTYLGSLTIASSHTTINGFTIKGFNASPTVKASTNILLNRGISNITVENNNILIGQIGNNSNGDDGIGFLTTYTTDNIGDSIVVRNNVFKPLDNTGAYRAFFINVGIEDFTFSGNTITGNFTKGSLTQAKNGIIENNTVTGTGDSNSRSAGIGTWGYPDPDVWGKTIFKNNTISGTANAISIYETNNVTIENNNLSGNGTGVFIANSTPIPFSPTTLLIQKNNLSNEDKYGVQNISEQITGNNIVNATYNWWGHASGPYDNKGLPGNPNYNNTLGTGSSVTSNVDYKPWYKDANMTILSNTVPSKPTGLYAKFQYDSENIPNGGTLNITGKPGPYKGNNLELLWNTPDQIDLVTGYRILATYPDNTTKLSWQGPNTNAWLRDNNGFGAHGNGKYSYQVIAANANGTSEYSDPFVIYYDTHIPTATFTSAPDNNSYINGDFAVAGTAHDNVALKSVFFDVRSENGGTWISGCKSGTINLVYTNENKDANIACTIDTSRLVSGQRYMLRIHVGDYAGYGNVNKEAERYFTMDKTGPTVPVLESPIGGVYINDNTPLMQWSNSSDDYSGVKGYYYRVFRNCTDISDSSTCSGVYPDLTGLWRTNSEYQAGSTSDGTYYWQVMAEDNAGNKSNWSNLEKVTIDTKAPDAPVITLPTAGSYFTSTPILNQWTTVTDSSGIAYYRVEYVYDDKHPFSDMPYRTTTSTQRNHIPGTWEQGGVTIRVQAVDNTGNEGAWSDAVHYTYDETKPTTPTNLTFKTTTGDVLGCNISTNKYTIVANWEASLDYSPLTYEYRSYNPINGWIWNAGNIGNTTEREGSFTVGDGTYGFAVRAVDAAGNYSDWTSTELTDSCQITYDSIGPVVTLSSPEDNYFTNQTVVKQSWDTTATDIAYYQYRSCENNQTNGNCTVIHKEDHLSDKTREVNNNNIAFWWQVRGIDNAGNVGEWSEPRKITIDTIAPAVDITSHKEGDLVKGEITITGEVIDLNLSHYWFVITNSSGIKVAGPDTVYTSANPAQITLDWNTENLPDGEYTIKLEARDLANNKDSGSSVEWVKIVVDKTAPTTVLNDDLSGKYTNQPILIKGVSTDTNGIDSVNIYYRLTGTTDWTPLTPIDNTPNNSPYNFEYIWTPTSDGTYDIKVSATDTVGNSENSPTIDAVTYDTTEPSAPTLTGYPIQYVKWGNVTRTWSPSISNDVDYYMYENITNGWTSGPYDAGSSEYSITHNTGNYDRIFEWKVYAVDYAGNKTWSVDTYKVVVDGTKPTIPEISNITLNEGATIPEIKGTITDTYNIESLSYNITGPLQTSATLTPLSETNSWEINISKMIKDELGTEIVDTSLIPEGTYTFTYSATDNAGNTSEEKSFNIFVNNVAPSITSLVLSSSTINEGNTLTVIPTFTDPSYISGNTPDDSPWTYSISYGDGTTTNGTQNTPGTFLLTHTYTHNGTYDITLTICEATDEININSENECATSTQSIEVLNDSPLVSLTPLLTTVTQDSEPVVISSSITGGNQPYTYTWTGCTDNGDQTATVTTGTLGTNTCTLTITDNDGDTFTANAVVVVVADEPQVLGTKITTNKTVTTTKYEPLGVGGPEESTVLSENNTTNPEVKGVNECQDKKTISGYVYIDSNSNGEKENNEKLLKDIEIRIYTKTDNGEETIEQVKTDEKGYWETKVCEGEYFIEINTESLPNNTSLDNNVKSVSITANTNESTVDFSITDTRNFIQKYWPWLLFGVVSVGLITFLFVTNRNKKEL